MAASQFTDPSFSTAEGWEVIGYNPQNVFSNCGPIGDFFGGVARNYNHLKEFQLYDIPAYKVEVEFTIVLVGNWLNQAGHTLEFYIDSTYAKFIPLTNPSALKVCNQGNGKYLSPKLTCNTAQNHVTLKFF